MSDIDPIQYGALIAKVASMERDVTDLRSDVKTLLELANKSRGGFWAGMWIASLFGGIVTYAVENWMRK